MGEFADMARFGMQTRVIVGMRGTGERIFADGRPDYDPPSRPGTRPPRNPPPHEPNIHWRMKKPTVRQMMAVDLIGAVLGETTKAKTRGGVSDFLDRYLNEAKRSARGQQDYSYFDDDNPGGKYGT